MQKNQIPQVTLTVALVVYAIIDILLTPLGGFMTRPAINPRGTSFGQLAIVLLLSGAALGLVSAWFVSSHPLRSVILGLIGAGLYYAAFLADGAGPYSSQSPPAYIVSLMTAQSVIALVVIFLAAIYLPPRKPRTRSSESTGTSQPSARQDIHP